MEARRQAICSHAIWIVAAATPLAVGPPARADDNFDGTTLTPMVHAQWHDDARRVSDDYVFSLALGRELNAEWNLELAATQGEFDGIGGDDLVITTVGLHALRVFYRDSRISPYFLLGLGWEEENSDFASTEHDPYADTAFGLLVALGGGAAGRSSVSLRGEVKARHTFVGDGDRLVDYLAGVGVQFAFGRSVEVVGKAPIPAQSGPFDSDADGIRDDTDRCPATPPGARIDDTGCERDSDRDGVLDSRDKCPGSRPNLTVDASGCEADSDNDGVLESADRCPGTPRRDKIDAAGCSLTVRLEVHFESNSAELQPESSVELDRAAALLRDVQSIAGVIEGHTDDVGSASHNLQLSQRRAETVREYLVGKGVDPSRLSAQGLGETQHVADNSTAEGRALNRRVVLRRTDQR